MLTFHLRSVTRLGNFFAIWATFLSLSQQLFCPNYDVFRQFVNGVKIFHFSSEISSKNENKSWYLKKAENKLIFDSCHLNSHRPSQT